ncbi:hypothetical protein [Companilactobacillus mishanensis]|uniref:WxL domain-containing protein n=1 Tax=Companilactobacillus mishanensis TaxID=2486008 RepID=A0ABW9P3L9_9LACO|nr:hypothetical protein [Companilactobacillus mishanensis]MQS43885.1 hypothetical protein [Companilactobacillus mishanensis]
MKQNSLIVVTALVVSLLFGSLLITESLVNGDIKDATIEESDLTKYSDGETASNSVSPQHTPSDPAGIALGLIYRPGFKVQPKENYYAQVGTNVRINTKFVRVQTLFGSVKYNWFLYEPGSSNSWNGKIKEEQSYIDLSSTSPTTKYVQLRANSSFYDYYSNMAAVHFSEKPIDAKKLDVSLDTDYLSIDDKFNKESALATASPDPIDSTGKITFSTKDNNLVNVNQETGEITLSGTNETGVATIKATIKNSDNTEVSGEAPITVGHVLTGPSTVYAGKDAKFKLNGNINTNEYQIDWYKLVGTKEVPIAINGSKELTIPVSKDDNGTEIRAKLKHKSKINTIVTNSIKLTVKDIRPVFEVYQFIGSQASSIFFSREKQIADLTPGFGLIHALIITDQSEDSNISWRLGTLYAPISKNEDVVSVEIQNKLQKYEVKEIDGKKTLVIPDFGIKHRSGVEIKIHTKVSNKITQESFEYNPSFVATDIAGNEFIVRFPKNTATFQMPEVPEETPDPDDGKIDMTPSKIEFGKHPKLNNREIHIVKKADDLEMVKIEDTRSEYKPVELSVQSEGPFHKVGMPNTEAPITFRFITKSGNEVDLRKNVVLKQTEEGQPLQSINWKEFEGLKIYIQHNQFDDGNYTTSLLWTVSDVPKQK